MRGAAIRLVRLVADQGRRQISDLSSGCCRGFIVSSQGTLRPCQGGERGNGSLRAWQMFR